MVSKGSSVSEVTDNPDCTSNNSNNEREECSLHIDSNTNVYIGVYGYEEGSYTLTVYFDSDGDGISDRIDTDDDNDGISDRVEIANKLNPLNASDAQADFDDDGFSNAVEIDIGTNIRNKYSKPIWVPIMMDDIVTFVLAKR